MSSARQTRFISSLFSSAGLRTPSSLPAAAGLTDPPAPRHELPPPAAVRQQLCGQPPQRLHDGPAEADPSGLVHFLACVSSHREAAAPQHPESELGLRLRLHFQPRQLPQLLLQCGEERSDGPERRCRRTRQICRHGCRRRSDGERPAAQTCGTQAQGPAGHRRSAHRLVSASSRSSCFF